ncbi:hypothetical protein MMC20_000031 [Loxospora ochrophaea]|nr:hypothetical protein [Loxospora ochrophaea]
MHSAIFKILSSVLIISKFTLASPIPTSTPASSPSVTGDGQGNAVECQNEGISVLDCSSIGNVEVGNGNLMDIVSGSTGTTLASPTELTATAVNGTSTGPTSPSGNTSGPTVSSQGQANAVECNNIGDSSVDCSEEGNSLIDNGNVVLALNGSASSTSTGDGSSSSTISGNGQNDAAQCENDGESSDDCSLIDDLEADNGNTVVIPTSSSESTSDLFAEVE